MNLSAICQSPCARVMVLLGENPSTYSKSRIMWNAAFFHFGIDAEYIPLDVPAEELDDVVTVLVDMPKVVGFNVTNPYKERVASHKHIIVDASAQIVGNVNTVHSETGKHLGYSTDGYGVVKSIEHRRGFDGALEGRKIVVLGAGGSGTAVAVACVEAGGLVYVANRTYEKVQALAERALKSGVCIHPVALYDGDRYADAFLQHLREAEIVINTLPTEKTEEKPLFTGVELIGNEKLLVDIVYGHYSFFLHIAERYGHKTVTGERMLLYQAVRAFEYVFARDVVEWVNQAWHIQKPMLWALDNFQYDTPDNDIKERIGELQ